MDVVRCQGQRVVEVVAIERAFAADQGRSYLLTVNSENFAGKRSIRLGQLELTVSGRIAHVDPLATATYFQVSSYRRYKTLGKDGRFTFSQSPNDYFFSTFFASRWTFYHLIHFARLIPTLACLFYFQLQKNDPYK